MTEIESSAPLGLRERKKEAARLALHEAAFTLVVDHGLPNVTVEAIAEAASMSRRTFSNYFSSKEEAIFYRDAQRSAELIEFVRRRPDDESPLTAFTHGLMAHFKAIDSDAEQHAQRRLIRQHPDLAAYRAGAEMKTQADLAAEFARRLPAGEAFQARVLATLALSALRAARSHWLEDQSRPLTELITEALAHVKA